MTLGLTRDVSKLISKLSPCFVDLMDTFSYSTIVTDQALGNLVNLMSYDHWRSIIVGQAEITFNNHLTVDTSGLKTLNSQQKNALVKSIQSEQLHLIVGLPGTGKTLTIVEIVKYCVEKLGLSVLIASFTNSAVDNVLWKLEKDNKFKQLRLGRYHAIHPNVRHLSETTQTKSIHEPEELEAFYQTRQIVAATCLGADHPLFKGPSGP